MKNIYLIVGKSGSGKSSIVHELCDKFGYKEVQSYTERPKRYEDEIGHIFITKEEFDKLDDLCAYTIFNGNRYGVPASMVNECDLYVIDTYGVNYMRKHYKGPKNIKVIGIISDINPDTDKTVRFERMIQRGDSKNDAHKRIVHDEKAFANWNALLDFEVLNDDFYRAVNDIKEYIDDCERR